MIIAFLVGGRTLVFFSHFAMLRFCRTWFKASILHQRVFDLLHGPGWVAAVVVVVVVVVVGGGCGCRCCIYTPYSSPLKIGF